MVKIIGGFTTYIGNDGDARRAQWDKSKVQNGFNPCLWTALLVRYKKHTTSSYYTMAMWVVKISKRVITFNETPRYFLSFVNYWVGNHIIKISCFRNWSFQKMFIFQNVPVMKFLCRNGGNPKFVSLPWKLDNLYCHNTRIGHKR